MEPPSSQSQPLVPQLLEGLFERTADGVLLSRPDGVILRANPAACRLLGRTEAELCRLGRGGIAVDDPALRALIAEREAAGVASGIIRLSRPDGSTFPAELTTAIIPGPGGEPHACVIFRDLSGPAPGGKAAALESAIDRLPVGVVVVELAAEGAPRVVAANAAYGRLIGGAADPGTEVARLAVRSMRPDRRTPIPPGELPGAVAARTGAAVSGAEVHLVRPDGTWRIVSVSAAPVGGPGAGSGRRAVSVMLDVTEERAAWVEVRASEAKLRAVVEGAADAFFLHDFSGRIRDVNPQACRSLGYTREELLRLTVVDVDVGFDLASAQAEWAKVEPGQPFTLRGLHRRKDGSTFPAEIRFSRVDQAGERIFMVLVRDMSEQLAREAALEASRRALRVLVGTNEALLRARSEQALFQEVCRVAVEQGGMRMAWAGVAEPGEGRAIRPLAWHGHEAGYLADARLTWADVPHGRGTAGEAMRTGLVAVANDIAGDPRMAPWREAALARGYASNAALPLVYQGERLGIIGAFSSERDAFSAEVIEVMQRVADDLAFGLAALRARAASERAAAEMSLAGQLIGLEVSRLDLATGLVSMPRHARATRGLPPDGPDFPIESVLGNMDRETRLAFERNIAAARVARPEAPDLPLPRPRAFHRPDGEVRWIDSVARVLFDDAGRPEAILSAAIEVTERVREREQLRALTARVQQVREEEKARIARDLHDDLGQVLTALRLELRGAETMLEAMEADERTGPIADRLVSASTLAADTIGAVQRLSWNLRSEALERLGLDAALRQELRRFQQRTGLEVIDAVRPVEGLSLPVATAAFRIAQEALTNVARHAGARRVEVALAPDGAGVRLVVADDGRGLPPGGPLAGDLGLLGMRERAREFGGEVAFSPREGGGTVVVASLPRTPGATP